MQNYRFGPFFVDRAGYRVTRDGEVLELTPKLLDLLLHLLDTAGTLVTKEQLLDALWPDANVTENALAQAVSELRQALGDEAGDPDYIKTVARRGYRFIAPVERVDPEPVKVAESRPAAAAARPTPELAGDTDRAIAVMDFTNVTGDPESAWLSAGIAETVTGDLRAIEGLRVVDRGRVMETARRTNGSLHEVASALGVPLAVVGSFQQNGDRIRITGRIVDLESGEALADAKVDGPLDRIFELQDQVVVQFSKDLGFATAIARRTTPRETSSLEAYRAFTEGWLQLETLDVGEIPRAIGNFERAIAKDRRYALAYTGLASAELAAYEATRAENAPAQALLGRAIEHARQAVALDDSLAEAHATLALILVSAWETEEAVRAARRAVAIEPTNWRHFFRLGHASWGDERLHAAANTVALYPDFAFAHFQMAMVHVARGDLPQAETVLRQGAAVQDRQIDRGERYPALGLHWLLGLVRLAQEDVEDALVEFARERELAEPHRLYGREYTMHAWHASAAALLRSDRAQEAIGAFQQALDLYPDHAASRLGLALALDAAGSRERAATTRGSLDAILQTLAATRPIEHAVVRSQVLATSGQTDKAVAVLSAMLGDAPPGFAAWTVPVEPLLYQVIGKEGFRPVLDRLAERAT